MNYIKAYTTFLNQFLRPSGKIRALIDTSNGSTSPVVKELLREQKEIETILINDTVDGNFPGHGPNPLDPTAINAMKQSVIENKVDLGVVFDGDGDRVFFFDELGELLGSYDTFDQIKHLFKEPYVVDVRALAKFTMPTENIVESKVGRFFIVQAMKENDSDLGVEYSGHFYYKNFFFTDVGILTMIHMFNHVSNLKKSGRTLSEARKTTNFVRLPEENFITKNPEQTISFIKEHFLGSGAVTIEEKDGLTIYGETFALNIRPSATEPVLRCTVVGRDNNAAEEILGIIRAQMNTDE